MVSKATRSRILKALQEHGYYRNALVRSLKANRTHVIGILVSEIGVSFFAEFVQAAEKQASAHGLQCFLCQTHSRREVFEKELTALREYRVDGVLILPSSSEAFPNIYKTLLAQKFPFVLADVPISNLKTPFVGNDNASAGRLIGEHLISLGHRRIAYINGYHESQIVVDRLDGFKQALRKARIPFDPSLVTGNGFGYEHGRTGIADLRKKGIDFTAVVASSDYAALGAIRELAAQGLRVPDDISIVGCGNMDFSSFVIPSLTTIDQNPRKLGCEAVETLIKQIEGRSSKMRRVIIAPELIVRSSTNTVSRSLPRTK